MVRSLLSVVVGVVIWMEGFYALAIGLAQLWPDYAIHGRQWVRENVFTFTPAMAWCNLALWVLAEIGAGWWQRRFRCVAERSGHWLGYWGPI